MVEKKKKKKKGLKPGEPLIYSAPEPKNELKGQFTYDPNKRAVLLDPEVISRIDKIYQEVRQKSKSKEPVTSADLPIEKTKPKSSFDETKAERRRIARGLPPKENTITVKEIGYEYGIPAKDLRRMIRKSGITRPGGRWEWKIGGKGLRKIKKLIHKSGKATKKPDHADLQ